MVIIGEEALLAVRVSEKQSSLALKQDLHLRATAQLSVKLYLEDIDRRKTNQNFHCAIPCSTPVLYPAFCVSQYSAV